MNESIISFKGRNGKVELYKDFLRLDRNTAMGFLNQGFKGQKDIYFKNITAIQIKEPGFSVGYLQFSILGGNESRGGIFAAVKDENTICFNGNDKYKQALKIKEYIEKKQQAGNQVFDVSSKIEKMYLLFEKGILTKDEFEKEKKKILNN